MTEHVRCLGGPFDGRMVEVRGPHLLVALEGHRVCAVATADGPWHALEPTVARYTLRSHLIFPSHRAYVLDVPPARTTTR